MKVGTVLSDEGVTRIVPFEKVYPGVKIEFFKEEWVNDKKRRSYICKLEFYDHKIQLCEVSLQDLVRRLGHVLLALTEDIEQ